MGVFAIKRRIFHAQRLRYRQRLRDLGDNGEDLEDEKRRDEEAAELTRSIILDPSATHTSLERSFDIRFEKLGLTLPNGVEIIKVSLHCSMVKVLFFNRSTILHLVSPSSL